MMMKKSILVVWVLLLLLIGAAPLQAQQQEEDQLFAQALAMAAPDPSMQQQVQLEIRRIKALPQRERVVAMQALKHAVNAVVVNKAVKNQLGAQAAQDVVIRYKVNNDKGSWGLPTLANGVIDREFDVAGKLVIDVDHTAQADGSLSITAVVANFSSQNAQAFYQKYATTQQRINQVLAELVQRMLVGKVGLKLEESPIYKEFSLAAPLAIKEDADEQEQTNPADDPLTIHWMQTAQSIYNRTGKKVFGLLYCRECKDVSINKKEALGANDTYRVQVPGKKCLMKFFTDNGAGTFTIGPAVTETYQIASGRLAVIELLTTNKYKDGQALLGVYKKDPADLKSLDGHYCSEYIEEVVSSFDFCAKDISDDNHLILNSLFSSLEQCLLDQGVFVASDGAAVAEGTWEYSSEMTSSLKSALNTPLSANEKIRIEITKGDNKQVLKSGEFTDEQSNYNLKIDWDEASKSWKMSMQVSQSYLKSLGGKFNDPGMLASLIQKLDEIALQAQVNFCSQGSIDANCTSDVLRLFQVMNLNLRSIAQTGTIHKAMWSESDNDGVRHLMPEFAKWLPVAGGVVDGVVEEGMGIPMLTLTLGELMIDEKKRAAVSQLFTDQGMVQMRQAISKEIVDVIRYEDKRHYTVSKTSVQVVFFLLALEAIGSKTLNEVLEHAQRLGKKLENSPTLQSYVVKLAKGGDEGLAKARRLEDLLKLVDAANLEKLVAKVGPNQIDDLLADLAESSTLRAKLLQSPELVDSWKRLADLGRNQMRKDPSILISMRKAMDNPNLPSDKLDNIVNRLADSGARCKTCSNTGTDGLRYIDEVLDDLDGFAKEFKDTDGFEDFLTEMGTRAGVNGGAKATGCSWTLDALMNNRSKYFGGEVVDGFEIKHVAGRDFAADVRTKVGGILHFKEFKSWSSNLMGSSNMINQMAGTMSMIDELDQMKFFFNPSRWTPTASQFKTALQGKKSLIEAVSDAKKTQLFGTTNVDEIIDIMSSDEVFKTIIKVQ